MNDKTDVLATAEQKPLRSLRELYFEIGMVLSSPEQARYSEAIAAYEQALKENDSPLAVWKIHFQLAIAHERIENIQQAFHSYLEALAEAPQFMSELLEAVHTLLKRLTLEMLTEEQDWLQQEWLPKLSTAQLSEGDDAYLALFLGRMNLYLQHYQEARINYERALQLHPQNIHALEGLGQALMHLGELYRSIDVFSQAYDLVKQQHQTDRIIAICNKLARVLAASEQYKAALALFEEAYSLLGNELLAVPDYACKMFLTLAQCHLALGDATSAQEVITRVPEYDLIKSSSTAQITYELLRTRIFISQRQYDDALGAADQVLQKDPFSNEALLYKIQVLFEGVIDVGQARRQLRRSMKKKKMGIETVLAYASTVATATQQTNGNGHYFLAQVYYALERYSEARQELNQARQLTLTNTKGSAKAALWQLEAELFEAEGHTKEAADNFYSAGRELYTTTTKYAEVIELLTHAVELNPDHNLALLFLSAALSEQASTTTPPSEELLKQSLDIWNKSYALGLPPGYLAWAYALRAACLQKIIDVNSADEERLWWESLYYLERAVILDTSQEYQWGLLQFGYLNLYKGAVAQQIGEQQSTPFGQVLLHFYQDDELTFDEIDRYHADLRRQQIENEPATSLQVVLLYLRGKYDDAIQLTLRYLKASPVQSDAFLRYYLGRSYLAIGQVKEAMAEFQGIWDATSPGGKMAIDGNLSIRADAASELGNYDDAIAIYQKLLAGTKNDSSGIHAYLAYCFILTGQLDAARQELNASLNKLEYIVEGHLALIDLTRIENKLGEKAGSSQAQSLLREYRTKLEEKMKELKTTTSNRQVAVEELHQVLEDTHVQKGSFSWLASLAGLARLEMAAKSWQSTIEMYETLLHYINESESYCFPEASIGLARTYAFFGCDLALQGTQEAALHHLKRSLDIYTESGQSNPALELIHDCSQLISSHEHYSIICHCLRLLAASPTLLDEERQNLLAARLTLSREKYPSIIHPVEWKSTDEEKPSKWNNEFGWTTPALGSFTIEIGLDLLIIADHTTIEDSVEADLMNTCLPKMRASIREQCGVIIPGFQIRDNLTIDPNSYQFLSYGELMARGIVWTTEKYCPDAKSCQALGIEGTPMVNPVDGNEGLWLQRSVWEQAQTAGLALWNAYEYITFHLETVIRAKLERAIGVEETQITVQEWVNASKEDRQELMKLALPDALAIARLAQVLRGLVEWQVPITNLEIILQVFAQENTRSAEILEIIEATRHALSSTLPGKNVEQTEIGISAAFEEAVHLQSDAEPDFETRSTLSPDILPLVLHSLTELGVQNTNESLILQLINTNSIHHTSAEDIVEIAFARLRSTRINIQLPSQYVNADTNSPPDHGPLSALFKMVEERLFNERGILLPQFDPGPSSDTGDIKVQINDRAILLTTEPWSSNDELASKLVDLLSKTAHALISIDDLEYRIVRLYNSHPTLVKAALARFSIEDLTRVARGLVSRGESIQDLRLILERLLEFDTIPNAAATNAIYDNRVAIAPETVQGFVYAWPDYLKF